MKIIQLALVLDNPEQAQNAINWAQSHHLLVKGHNVYYVDIAGTPDVIASAFQADLTLRQDGSWFPQSDPVKPAGVHAIVGIDARPTGHRNSFLTTSNEKSGFYPKDIQAAYNIPDEYTGEGETIGILQFNSDYSQDSLDAFTMETGLTTLNRPNLVTVDGGDIGDGTSPKDKEATLDIEWAYAIAPKARIAVYEAPNGSHTQTFSLHLLHALYTAITDSENNPSVLSISYGVSESAVPEDDLRGWEKLIHAAVTQGIIVCVSSGDTGAYGKNQPNQKTDRTVDGPASCPSALAVGGTKLLMKDGNVTDEQAWTNTGDNGATGGGTSQTFPMPFYQKQGGLTGTMRGVPDVAANADPNSGYFIIFDGLPGHIGGTSAATPVWAGIFAGMNQQRKQQGLPPLDHLHEKLYALQGQGFRDITEGNNNHEDVLGYEAGPGWDYCTGWGSPLVTTLASLLKN